MDPLRFAPHQRLPSRFESWDAVRPLRLASTPPPAETRTRRNPSAAASSARRPPRNSGTTAPKGILQKYDLMDTLGTGGFAVEARARQVHQRELRDEDHQRQLRRQPGAPRGEPARTVHRPVVEFPPNFHRGFHANPALRPERRPRDIPRGISPCDRPPPRIADPVRPPHSRSSSPFRSPPPPATIPTTTTRSP